MLSRLQRVARRTALLRRAPARVALANAGVRRASTGASGGSGAADLAVYVSGSNDPFFNLGTEQFLFDNGGRLPSAAATAASGAGPKHTLFLWRNGPAVIIGAHQNPWKECFVERLQADGVHLVRRRSGGGAVFQDLGNSIFTFMTTPKHAFDKDRNTAIVLRALHDGFGVSATASGRNDIAVDGKKISGSAFKHSNTTSLHHGTVLLDVEMSRLGNYLNPSKAKLASKGVTSVVARVLNLKSQVPHIDHDSLNTALRNAFVTTYAVDTDAAQRAVPVTLLTPDTPELKNSSAHAQCVAALKDWDWRFGKTPDFSHHMETRFDWGIMDVHFDVVKGRIRSVKIYSDALFAPLIESLHVTLTGAAYSVAGINAAVSKAKAEMEATASPAAAVCDDFAKWLSAQIAQS